MTSSPPISEAVLRLAGWRMPSPRSSVVALSCYMATGRIDGFTLRLGDDADAERLAASLLISESGGHATQRGEVLAAAAGEELLSELLTRLRSRT
jgi:hypothetical protein